MDMITYPCWDHSQFMLVKGASDDLSCDQVFISDLSTDVRNLLQ